MLRSFPIVVILLASRAGVIEIVDPETLGTIRHINFPLPAQSVGLNGIAAKRDGSMLFVDGPIPSAPNVCCSRYAIDPATMHVSEAMKRPAALGKPSPDGRWRVNLISFRGPAVEIFDAVNDRLIARLAPGGLAGNSWPAGVWSRDKFFFYVYGEDGGGKLWTLSPADWQLGEPVAVASFNTVPGCEAHDGIALAAADGKLFLYEPFGFKADRRQYCDGVPGGAWLVDPATGKVQRQIAPDLYFSNLFAGADGRALYGLSCGLGWQSPVQIVRLDPGDGHVALGRVLDAGFWRADLGSVVF